MLFIFEISWLVFVALIVLAMIAFEGRSYSTTAFIEFIIIGFGADLGRFDLASHFNVDDAVSLY